MSRIVVFGAGGTFGRIFIAEATRRGHQVTAVVRDTAKHADLTGDGIELVSGDALDAASVASVAVGHDVAVDAINISPDAARDYYVVATKALLAGLASAGPARLLIVGGAGSLEIAPGQRLVDTPDFKPEWKHTALAHGDSLDYLRTAETSVDWVYISPAAFFDATGARTGRYRVGGEQLLTDAAGNSHISYADYAIALVDEIETAKHHNERITFAD